MIRNYSVSCDIQQRYAAAERGMELEIRDVYVDSGPVTVVIDDAYLPYSHQAYLADTDFTRYGHPIGYGHSPDEAVDQLVAELQRRAMDEE